MQFSLTTLEDLRHDFFRPRTVIEWAKELFSGKRYFIIYSTEYY